ncbi:hypothetical protein [Chryseobacterium indologenes]|uniref:hypothetical protein n=1 Tax=Chryseobacterium indologenes TaxID=253 RepID=UPI00076E3244|nr:hypothetical protein [Chryseobacterium indologenes]
MKKLFFIAAIAVAGTLSAKPAVVKSAEKKERTESKSQTKKAAAPFGCVPVSYSCGVKGYACGSNTVQMLINAWEGESLFCG